MSGQKKSSRKGKRQKQDDENASGESTDNEVQPIHFFIPGDNINTTVLVDYINKYVDRAAKISIGQHPNERNRPGYNISAKRSLNAVSIRDLINDSRDWDLEMKGREYKMDAYDYRESDTARRRAKNGPSEGGTNHPARARRNKDAGADVQDPLRQERQVQQSGGGGMPPTSYGSPYNTYPPQTQPYQVQTSQYGYQQPGRNDQAPTNFSGQMDMGGQAASGRGGQDMSYSTGSYNPGGYGSGYQNPGIEPPPAYQVTSRGGGQAPQPAPQPVPTPSQPGGGTFDTAKVRFDDMDMDRDEKPPTDRPQNVQNRRGSSYDQPTPAARRAGRQS